MLCVRYEGGAALYAMVIMAQGRPAVLCLLCSIRLVRLSRLHKWTKSHCWRQIYINQGLLNIKVPLQSTLLLLILMANEQ